MSRATIITEPSERITSNILTKYEVSSILASRAKEIENGSPYDPRLIDELNELNLEITNIHLAELELKYGLIPYYIYRTIGDGVYERWKISEMYYRSD